MIIVQICVGSSCHLKGSEEIVALFQSAIEEHQLDGEIALVGSFCIGQCNRLGVTVQVDDVVHTGVTKESFREFFKNYILTPLENERK